MGHKGMHYSLPSRELIADTVETVAEAHQLDGLILLTACDKITPGMLMAAARLNIPSMLIIVVARLDKVMGELEKFREDRVLAKKKDDDQDEKLAAHEKRLLRVESKVGV